MGANEGSGRGRQAFIARAVVCRGTRVVQYEHHAPAQSNGHALSLEPCPRSERPGRAGCMVKQTLTHHYAVQIIHSAM
jgi:hypothetical protein